MPKRNPNNLRVKRKYLIWLQEAKGFSEASIDKAAAAISTYERFLEGKDFRAFHPERARAFKRCMASQKNERSGAPLSTATIGGTLREVKAFFAWLADQPGYKSKISHSEVAYLTPDRKSEAARRSSLWKPHPSLEQVRSLIRHMPTETVVLRRDRALVAFLFLSGSREGAAITLRLGHVDLRNTCVQFDGRTVHTKFSKSFTTSFFPVGTEVELVVRNWIQELRTVHLFSDTDPLFPKTKVGLGSGRQFKALGIAREPWASPSSAAKIFKQAFASAGMPPFSPHRVRDTLTELAREHCRSPEDYKAWSQNLGHDSVLTTFNSYGSVSPGRQMELIKRFGKRGPLPFNGDDDVIE